MGMGIGYCTKSACDAVIIIVWWQQHSTTQTWQLKTLNEAKNKFHVPVLSVKTNICPCNEDIPKNIHVYS